MYVKDSWIKNYFECREDELLSKIKSEIVEGIYIAAYTDKVIIDVFSHESVLGDLPHLLEIRIFNISMEFKAWRQQMGRDFICRSADDSDLTDKIKVVRRDDSNNFICKEAPLYYFDEVQYIDWDKTKTVGSLRRTQGGGKYTLPRQYADYACVRIRNYLNYSDEGNVIISDWRAVGFERSEK